MSALGACGSDHRVSPWGVNGRLDVGVYVPRPDLAAELAEVDREMAAIGLQMTLEIPGTFSGGRGAFRVRGYGGKDPLGRPVHAVRVVTTRAIALAVGPLDPSDLQRGRATELVPALLAGPDPGHPLEAAAYVSGHDLTGDGSPDVVMKNEAGVLEVWHFEPLGASAYDIGMAAPPTSGADVDRDGRVDLVGRLGGRGDDQIAPVLEDVATFERVAFTNTSATARAFHERRAAAVSAARAKLEHPTDEERLRAAIELAWHSILAGKAAPETLKVLDQERAPARLRGELERWRAVVARADPRALNAPTR